MVGKNNDIAQDEDEDSDINHELENEKKMSLQEEESSSSGLIVGLTVTVIVVVIVVIVGGLWHRKRSKSRQIISYLLTPYGKFCAVDIFNIQTFLISEQR